MRRVLIFSILLCVAVMAFGETSVKARRGDTWISIATKYDVDPVELKAINGNIAECYVGMNVVIPDYMLEKAKLQREAKLNEEKHKALINLYEKADDFEKLGKLKDAKKVYDEILKQDHSAQAYYGRGWVQYNRKKWKDAISDLNYAATLPDASAELKESANELSRDASERKAEADAKRSELIGNIIGATVATAGIVAGTVMMSKAVKNSGQTRSTPSHPSTIRSLRTYSPASVQSNSGKMSLQEQYDKYLSPEAFMYNYTHGLPTLPNSTQMGLTGSDAYAYDLQNKLQYQTQLIDIEVQKETERLVADGMEKAEKEIRDFPLMYGREPTAEEIQQIYAKYTQGYTDAYSTYVSETVSTSKELGLGAIERTKPSSNSYSNTSTSTSSNTTTSTETDSKRSSTANTKNSKTTTTSSNKSSAPSNSKDNKNKSNSPKPNNAHEQFKNGNLNTDSDSYGHKLKNVSMAVKDGSSYRNVSLHGELYKKANTYFVKIGNTFFRVFNTSGVYNSYIDYGAKAHYFNR